MKKNINPAKLRLLLFAALCFFGFQQIAAQAPPRSHDVSPLPAPTGFVNDYAGVIDAATKQRLEQKIKDFRDRTKPPVELAVAVVQTTGGTPIFDYSLSVARGWGIEQLPQPIEAILALDMDRISAFIPYRRNDLLALWQTFGWTVVFVTHSVFESVYLSNRIVVMAARPGRIHADLAIEAPYPRTESFRMSEAYNDYCRRASAALHAAMEASAP